LYTKTRIGIRFGMGINFFVEGIIIRIDKEKDIVKKAAIYR
jgi:hypothetical protein